MAASVRMIKKKSRAFIVFNLGAISAKNYKPKIRPSISIMRSLKNRRFLFQLQHDDPMKTFIFGGS